MIPSRLMAWLLVSVCLLLPACRSATSQDREAARSATQDRLAGVSLQLSDLDGRPVDLQAELDAGKSVAFVFWQEACPSCAREAPRVVDAEASHGERIAFVGVIPGSGGVLDPAKLRTRKERLGYRFPQVLDRDDTLTRALAVEATPTLVVLGPEREVLYHEHVAPSDWSGLSRP